MNDVMMPIGIMMDLAKKEIGGMVQSVMENNHIPPDLMIYILESIGNDLARLKNISDAEQYMTTLEEMKGGAEDGSKQ